MDSRDASPSSPPIPPTLHEPATEPVGDLPQPFGRYRIVKKLGQGGMGAVYLAHDNQLDRQVALKVPSLSSEDRQSIERFYREARAAATLDHPNLCPVHDVGEIAGRHYLTMGYVEGHTLAELIRGGPPLPLRPVADLVRKLAVALQEAHAKGVIHRDLKPGNIIVNRRNEPVVLDFGLARLRSEDVRLTAQGTLLGTPAYMPPEQVRGDLDAVGPVSDVYSLGVVLYELLTGKLPFTGNLSAVISQVLTSEPIPPRRHRAEIDPILEGICLKAMAKEPAQRYASMADLAAALAGYLSGGPVPTVPIAASVTDTTPIASIPGGATQLIGKLVARLKASEARARKRTLWPFLVAALTAAVVVFVAPVFFNKPPPPQLIIVYLNVPQLEQAEPGIRFVLIGGQRIPRDKLREPITLPAGTHAFSIERADGQVVEVGQLTLTKDDNDKAVEVSPEKGPIVVAKEEVKPSPVEPPVIKPLPEGKTINLAAATNGGWLADAPAEYDKQSWAARNLIDLPGNAAFAAPADKPPLAVVVGFKDGRSARIARVGVNPFYPGYKEKQVSAVKVELSPTLSFTGFKEVGVFKVPATSDDVFFPLATPQVARFVRFTFLKSSGGSYVGLSEVMVFGSLLDDGPPPPLVNVALAVNKAKIGFVTSEYDGSWKATNLLDGNPGKGWCSTSNQPQVVVIELARTTPIRFVAINPYAPGYPMNCVKKVKVFLSRTGEQDDYHLAGTLDMEAVGRDHVLELKPPVTAPSVKVHFLENHGGSWMQAHEIKVFAESTR